MHDALAALGGRGPLAECAWHVLGQEWSLRRLCRERIGGNPAEAAGVLVAVATLRSSCTIPDGAGRRDSRYPKRYPKIRLKRG